MRRETFGIIVTTRKLRGVRGREMLGRLTLEWKLSETFQRESKHVEKHIIVCAWHMMVMMIREMCNLG